MSEPKPRKPRAPRKKAETAATATATVMTPQDQGVQEPTPATYEARPRTLADIHHLSYSSITKLKDCPRSWAARYLERVEDPPSHYAAIGSAMHRITELHLKAEPIAADHPDLQIVPPEEMPNLRTYLEKKNDYRPYLFGTEIELKVPVDGTPGVLMYIDAAYAYPDGTIVLEDHKSNREYEGQEVWSRRVQPRLYAWGARQTWQGYPRVRFRIGYMNLGMEVEWETDPADDHGVVMEVVRAWRAIEAYYGIGVEGFPAIVGSACRYCPLKPTCLPYQASVNALRDSILNPGSPSEGPVERYVRLHHLIKAMEDELKVLKPDVIRLAEAGQATGVTLETRKSREVAFSTMWRLLTDPDSEAFDPAIVEAVLARADDLFSVKVGGLDKLVKELDLGDRLSPAVQSRQAESPTVKVNSRL